MPQNNKLFAGDTIEIRLPKSKSATFPMSRHEEDNGLLPEDYNKDVDGFSLQTKNCTAISPFEIVSCHAKD